MDEHKQQVEAWVREYEYVMMEGDRINVLYDHWLRRCDVIHTRFTMLKIEVLERGDFYASIRSPKIKHFHDQVREFENHFAKSHQWKADCISHQVMGSEIQRLHDNWEACYDHLKVVGEKLSNDEINKLVKRL